MVSHRPDYWDVRTKQSVKRVGRQDSGIKRIIALPPHLREIEIEIEMA